MAHFYSDVALGLVILANVVERRHEWIHALSGFINKSIFSGYLSAVIEITLLSY